MATDPIMLRHQASIMNRCCLIKDSNWSIYIAKWTKPVNRAFSKDLYYLETQGNQVPGSFRAGPEKYVYPGSPELFSKAQNFSKVSQMFLILWVFLWISTNICITRMQISSEIGIYSARYQNLWPMFAAARKNIFGKNLCKELALPVVVPSSWKQFIKQSQNGWLTTVIHLNSCVVGVAGNFIPFK